MLDTKLGMGGVSSYVTQSLQDHLEDLQSALNQLFSKIHLRRLQQVPFLPELRVYPTFQEFSSHTMLCVKEVREPQDRVIKEEPKTIKHCFTREIEERLQTK